MSKVIIVDEHDQVIGLKERDEITKNDIYRVSVLWIENLKGEILLTQRKSDKKVDPGCWSPAVAGTNEATETYRSNIYKEAEEELGLMGFSFHELPKISPNIHCNYFIMPYFLNADLDLEKDIVLQDSEVEAAAWFDPDALGVDIKLNPSKYVKSAPYWESWNILKTSL
ncbi:MAG TPA: NUDIX domain-containing protein [Candidatus Saccharibacteria bacterium]|nr:NUDIX domain-containing protein [Candidatus Saccharibacteria bacterium]